MFRQLILTFNREMINMYKKTLYYCVVEQRIDLEFFFVVRNFLSFSKEFLDKNGIDFIIKTTNFINPFFVCKNDMKYIKNVMTNQHKDIEFMEVKLPSFSPSNLYKSYNFFKDISNIPNIILLSSISYLIFLFMENSFFASFLFGFLGILLIKSKNLNIQRKIQSSLFNEMIKKNDFLIMKNQLSIQKYFMSKKGWWPLDVIMGSE